MKPIYKFPLFGAGALIITSMVLMALEYDKALGPLLILALILLAIGLRGHRLFRGFSYTVLILAAVIASLF